MVGIANHERQKSFIESDRSKLSNSGRVAERVGCSAEPLSVGSSRTLRGLANQFCAYQVIDVRVLLGGEALLQVIPPRLEAVDPCFECKYPPAETGSAELTAPSVVRHQDHGRLEPLGVSLSFMKEFG